MVSISAEIQPQIVMISGVISQGPGSEVGVSSLVSSQSQPTQTIAVCLSLVFPVSRLQQICSEIERDGPASADPKLLLNDKTSDHFQKSSLGKNFSPRLSTAAILLDVSD